MNTDTRRNARHEHYDRHTITARTNTLQIQRAHTHDQTMTWFIRTGLKRANDDLAKEGPASTVLGKVAPVKTTRSSSYEAPARGRHEGESDGSNGQQVSRPTSTIDSLGSDQAHVRSWWGRWHNHPMMCRRWISSPRPSRRQAVHW
jgi:hypothetical protein